MKTLLIASLVLLSITLCGCKEKLTTEELLSGYQYTLEQVANSAMESSQEAEAQASRGEISDEELLAQYEQITVAWALTIEEVDRQKQFKELWPLIFGSEEPPTLARQPLNPDLLQWQSYLGQVNDYIFLHYQLIDAAWRKLGYN